VKGESLSIFFREIVYIMDMKEAIDGGGDDIVEVWVVLDLGDHAQMHQGVFLFNSDLKGIVLDVLLLRLEPCYAGFFVILLSRPPFIQVDPLLSFPLLFRFVLLYDVFFIIVLYELIMANVVLLLADFVLAVVPFWGGEGVSPAQTSFIAHQQGFIFTVAILRPFVVLETQGNRRQVFESGHRVVVGSAVEVVERYHPVGRGTSESLGAGHVGKAGDPDSLSNGNGLLKVKILGHPDLDCAIPGRSHILHFPLELLRTEVLIFRENDDGLGDHIGMALRGAGGRRVFLIGLDVLEVLLLHGGECLVLKQHIVHELVPVHRPIRISVDFHEKLLQLFHRHVLPNDVSKGFDELIVLESHQGLTSSSSRAPPLSVSATSKALRSSMIC
jgi:hypothetical protein